MVYACALRARAARHVGSSPTPGTTSLHLTPYTVRGIVFLCSKAL